MDYRGSPAHRGYDAKSLQAGYTGLSWVAIALLVVGVYLFIKIAVFALRMALLVGIILLLYWLLAPVLGLPAIQWSGTEGLPKFPL